MYIDIVPENRTELEDDVLLKIHRLEERLLSEGETEITEERKIFSSRTLDRTTLTTITTYQHTLETLEYVATIVNTTSKAEDLTNPMKGLETVFASLEIQNNNKPIFGASRFKGGYIREPFLFLSRTELIKPNGWSLYSVASLDAALDTMEAFGVDYWKMKEMQQIEEAIGSWSQYEGPARFNFMKRNNFP